MAKLWRKHDLLTSLKTVPGYWEVPVGEVLELLEDEVVNGTTVAQTLVPAAENGRQLYHRWGIKHALQSLVDGGLIAPASPAPGFIPPNSVVLRAAHVMHVNWRRATYMLRTITPIVTIALGVDLAWPVLHHPDVLMSSLAPSTFGLFMVGLGLGAALGRGTR